jgi:hypothetical protein
MGYGAAVYGWGRGSEVFSTSVRRTSCYNAVGAVLTPQVEFFFYSYCLSNSARGPLDRSIVLH